jgi:hypothetical protein
MSAGVRKSRTDTMSYGEAVGVRSCPHTYSYTLTGRLGARSELASHILCARTSHVHLSRWQKPRSHARA